MADKLGTEGTNTLTEAAQEASQSSEGLNAQVRSLLSELEDDAASISGNALSSFKQAQNELVAAFNGLTSWLSAEGANLSLGQEKLTAADADSEEGYRSAASMFNREVTEKVES